MIRATLTALLVATPLFAAEPESAPPAEPAKTPLEDLFAAVDHDGALELAEPVRAQLVKLLPAPGRGQACEKPAEVHTAAVAFKDRGEGALLVAILSSCHGETVYAFAPGQPVRVAKLFENEDGRKLLTGMAMPLRGGEGAKEEIGLVLSGQTNELRFFVRRSERGFAFADSGQLPNFASSSQCDEGDHDHVSGYLSLVRVGDARNLFRLRLESRCGGGLTSARCEVWHLDQGQLEKRGACALPAKLDEADLRKSGWQ
jgi:hypothetical protein